MTLRLLVPLLAAGLAADPATGQPGSPLTADAWREDLLHVASELKRLHPGVFEGVSEPEFEQAVEQLSADAPARGFNQMLVGMMQIVALIPDSHTSTSSFDRRQEARSLFPVRLIELEGGVYVLSASSDHAATVGQRVVAIGATPIDSALAAVSTVIAHDSIFSVKRKRPLLMMAPAVLHGLGLIDSPDVLPLTLTDGSGTPSQVPVPAVDATRDSGWYTQGFGVPTGEFVTILDAVPRSELAVSLAHEGEIRGPRDWYWWEYLDADRTFYLRFSRVKDKPDESLAAFWSRMWDGLDRLPVDKLVIDLRENRGGNNFLVKPLIHGIIKRDAINRTGVLYVLIGRNTSSAGVSTAAWLETETNAVFIGEPTAQRPNLYSEPAVVVAPHSRFRVEVSRYQWVHTWPWDERRYIAPDIAVSATIGDLRAGRDPVLERALELESYRTLTEVMLEALEGGDALARERYLTYRAEFANPWKSTDGEMTELGYRLMEDGDLEHAITVLELNTRSHPEAGMSWAVLGWARARHGDRERAVACLERALQLEPDNGIAQRALAEIEGERARGSRTGTPTSDDQ